MTDKGRLQQQGLRIRPFLIACLLSLACAQTAHASGDGPRVHGPYPVGINFLNLHLSSLLDANRAFDPSLVTPLLKFDSTIAVIQYAHTTEISGRPVMFAGMLRGGNTTRKSNLPGDNASSSGLADPTVAASINLLGMPVMTPDTFVPYQPGAVVSLFLGLTLPWGEYDLENRVNLSSNRYALRVGVPFVYNLELFPGKLSSVELVPNIHLYTENSATGMKQDPLFTLEGNFTQDFSTNLWASVGYLWTQGGKTKINGRVQNGTQRSLSLSVSLSYRISPHWALSFRYGDTVYRNEFGLDGSLYHFKLITRF